MKPAAGSSPSRAGSGTGASEGGWYKTEPYRAASRPGNPAVLLWSAAVSALTMATTAYCMLVDDVVVTDPPLESIPAPEDIGRIYARSQQAASR